MPMDETQTGSALTALAQGIKPPMETPPTSGQGIQWEKLLSLLPIILAGMKGGMAGVGGYAQGWSQGERQNQAMAQRQDEMAYARQRQEKRDAIDEAERSRQRQRQTLQDLQGRFNDVVGAVPLETEYGASTSPDMVGPVRTTPEDRVRTQLQEAGTTLGADPSLVNQVAGQIPAAISQRKKTAAANILSNLKGVDPAALQGKRWMDNLTLDELVKLAGEAGAGFGLPKEQAPPPLREVEEIVGGQRVKTMKRLGEGDSVPVIPSPTAASEPGTWTDTGRVNDRGEAIYINNKTMQTRTVPGMGAKPNMAAEQEQATKRQVVKEAANKTLDSIDELLDESGRLKDNIKTAIGTSRVLNTWRIPGTSAYDANTSVERLRARLVTDLMGELKAQSRTGATGFGQLNQSELKIMQDSAAKLNPGQSEAAFEAELKKIRDRVKMILREPEASKRSVAPSKGISILKIEEVK